MNYVPSAVTQHWPAGASERPMIAESPTSPRARDRIAVDPISTDTIARLHAEAEATGRSIGDIAADWLDQWQPPTRRVVAVVVASVRFPGVASVPGAWGFETAEVRGIHNSAVSALAAAAELCPGARIEQAGAARYELVVDVTPAPTPAIDPGGTQGPIQPIQPTTQETR